MKEVGDKLGIQKQIERAKKIHGHQDIAETEKTKKYDKYRQRQVKPGMKAQTHTGHGQRDHHHPQYFRRNFQQCQHMHMILKRYFSAGNNSLDSNFSSLYDHSKLTEFLVVTKNHVSPGIAPGLFYWKTQKEGIN